MPPLMMSIRRSAALPAPVLTPIEMPVPQNTSGLWATPNTANGWLPERFTHWWAAIRLDAS